VSSRLCQSEPSAFRQGVHPSHEINVGCEAHGDLVPSPHAAVAAASRTAPAAGSCWEPRSKSLVEPAVPVEEFFADSQGTALPLVAPPARATSAQHRVGPTAARRCGVPSAGRCLWSRCLPMCCPSQRKSLLRKTTVDRDTPGPVRWVRRRLAAGAGDLLSTFTGHIQFAVTTPAPPKRPSTRTRKGLGVCRDFRPLRSALPLPEHSGRTAPAMSAIPASPPVRRSD